MNTSKHIAAAVAAFMATSQLSAAVVNITQGSTSGYTMTDGNTYVVQNSVSFSNSTAGGSGMTVADNATVVLYIPAGVTLTAKGGNGSGQTGGGAGIRVPSTATLIITGEGNVNATGGNAGNGGKGANGQSGTKPSTKYVGSYNGSGEYGPYGKGSSGIGGTGGSGGGGAGAAFGGNGGRGGIGGAAGESIVLSSWTSGDSFNKNGKDGNSGSSGSQGGEMGEVYLFGSLGITCVAGSASSKGSAGSFAESMTNILPHSSSSSSVKDYYGSCGGGGGGGGGAGSAPSCAIGGGGASGGGGGGGGSGALLWSDNSMQRHYPQTNAHGGGGSGGASKTATGASGTARASSRSGIYDYTISIAHSGYISTRYGGTGGAAGAAGAEGGAGTLYVSPTATVNVNRTKLSATTHEAAQYTISYDTNGGEFSSAIESLTATLGCALPDCIPTPKRRGYLFYGWATMDGVEYYDATGTKSLSSYPVVGNVTLYAQWVLDTDKAVLSDSPVWLRENAEIGWFVEPESGEETILRSGAIGNNTNSWMESTIVGPASFSFDWKVSCNTRGHYLAWFIDGAEQARIRGVADWATVTASIPEGEHVVRFDYVKGSTAAAGEDKGQVRNFAIDPVRIQTDSMQVMLDWTTNYLVSVSTIGFGSADFTNGWIADGSNVVVTLAPSIHSYAIAMSGDTDSAVLDGTNLTISVNGAARTIEVSIDEVKPHLVVVSAQGTPTPAVGDHLCDSDAEVTASVEAPDASGGIRAVCTGWTGTGSVPASGSGSSVTFTILEDSTITWNWATGYWVEFAIVGKGTTTFESQWVAERTNLVIPFAVNTQFYSLSLSGDTDGAAIGEGGITLSVTAPRSIILTVTEYTYEAALDSGRLTWTSGGEAVWIPQPDVSHDGQDAARSGEVIGDDVSTLSTIVVGPGTLSWWWKLEMADCAGVDVFVDEAIVSSIDSASDWIKATISIAGDGEHDIRFEFWNAGTAATITDCAYLDQVSWTPANHTATTPDPIPYAYFDTDYPALLAAHGGDYEAAANATAANGVNKVWECYVAGISPTNAMQVFRTMISWENGEPKISWEPDLNEDGAKHERVYRVLGAKSLDHGAEWDDMTDLQDYGAEQGYRFFKVDVELP